MSIQKYTKEFKLEVLKEHKEHGVSFYKLGKNYNIEPSIIRRWWHVYDIHGESGLDHHDSNLFNYSADFKQMVVRAQNGITPIPDTGFNLLGATPGGNIADGWYASDEMFDCVDDFIEAGGVFAGWLIGHTHTDYIGTVYGHSSQPIVIVGTSGSTSVNNKFITGTASQDNFNAITFENISDKAIVKIVKIGQDTDLYTRSKQTIAYNFTDGVLISTT